MLRDRAVQAIERGNEGPLDRIGDNIACLGHGLVAPRHALGHAEPPDARRCSPGALRGGIAADNAWLVRIGRVVDGTAEELERTARQVKRPSGKPAPAKSPRLVSSGSCCAPPYPRPIRPAGRRHHIRWLNAGAQRRPEHRPSACDRDRSAARRLPVQLGLRGWIKPRHSRAGVIEKLHLATFDVPGGDALKSRVGDIPGGGAVAARPGRQRHEKLARFASGVDRPSAEQVGTADFRASARGGSRRFRVGRWIERRQPGRLLLARRRPPGRRQRRPGDRARGRRDQRRRR